MLDCVSPVTSESSDRVLLLPEAQKEFEKQTGWYPSYRSWMRWAAQGQIQLVKVRGRVGMTEGELRRILAGRPRNAESRAA